MNAPAYANSNEPKRELPNNVEAEQALLGALLINNDVMPVVKARFLKSHHFYEPLHAKIYERAEALIEGGRVCNPVTIKQWLPAKEKVGDMTVAQYLARLAAESVTIINCGEYAESIIELSARRKLILIGEDLMNIAYDAPMDMSPAAIADETVRKLGEVHVVMGKAPQLRRKIGKSYLRDLHEAKEKKAIAGVPIAFDELSAVLSEPVFEAGNLYGLLGSSGEGKTSFMLQIAYGALKEGHPVLIQSFDQRADQFMRQLVAQNLSIDVKRQRYGDLTSQEWEEATDFAGWIDTQPIEIVRLTNEGPSHLAAGARKFCRNFANGKKPLVITDHIGAVSPPDKVDRSDEGKKAIAICQIIKGAAEESDAAWVMLNQRNSKGAFRDNPRPIAMDLYGGEGARQPYDAIAYLYRFKVWFNTKKAIIVGNENEWKKLRKVFPGAVIDNEADIAELGAIKVRYGATNITKQIDFQGKFTRYLSQQAPVAVPQEVDQLGFGGL